MFVARYTPPIPSARDIARRFVTIWISVSFFAILVPIASASRDRSVMACCIGKKADHCHAKLKSRAGGNSQTNAETRISSKSPSVGNPCPMSCGGCTATASRLQKRQKDFIQPRTSHISRQRAMLRFENPSRVCSSNKGWTDVSPRGPPAVFL